jgi:predicted DNA-binding transcriptional regulator AlpA
VRSLGDRPHLEPLRPLYPDQWTRKDTRVMATPSATGTGTNPLTVADFCAELGVAPSTFYDWRAKRRAPRCITLPNGSLRIRRAEYERWLASREDTA